MPAIVSGCPSSVTALLCGKYWWLLQCVLIFARIYGARSLSCSPIIGRSDGLHKFSNSDGMLAQWYMLLGQFSFTFEYRPGAQHANADGLFRQCGQCLRPACPVSSPDVSALESGSMLEIVDQPFASSTRKQPNKALTMVNPICIYSPVGRVPYVSH